MGTTNNCKGHNIDYNGSSFIVRVKKMGRFITHNTRYIYKTPILVKQYLREQIMK